MASPTQWTGVWANSGRWWRTGKPGMLKSMGSQRVGHNWATQQQQQQIFPHPIFLILFSFPFLLQGKQNTFSSFNKPCFLTYRPFICLFFYFFLSVKLLSWLILFNLHPPPQIPTSIMVLFPWRCHFCPLPPPSPPPLPQSLPRF